MDTSLNHSDFDVSKERLMLDLRLIVADAEELLRASAGEVDEKVSVARQRIEEHLGSAKARLADAEAAMLEKTKAAAQTADEYVHENPWRAVGIAAAVGLVLGMLISRGR
ncbi:MAG: DUF883 family protein [Rhodoferax sp.]|uniref:DUF883 family protein n=1 Tax=Rhodoferax sp. TaxID=50421 RepID=UPI0008D3C0F8|nr:DUF883 family protein [Rhodoferax sp.]MDP2680815.1 DUF883 family protein [Rhodoferax sp.]OGB79688.1 MAG: hypothetical protein A2496_02045 [Burkholderiales bacterium RIFOXYC12_FULL_60_6]